MEHLHELAEQGAPIIFYGNLPNAQAGYADGAYAAEDAKVAALANDTLLDGDAAYHPTSSNVAGKLSQAGRRPGDHVRHERQGAIHPPRPADGGALTYIRNTGTTTNTITLRADARYANFYWLDQETGRIHNAPVTNGQVTFTLDPGKDVYGGSPSHGIALLAEPAGVTLPAAALTPGPRRSQPGRT